MPRRFGRTVGQIRSRGSRQQEGYGRVCWECDREVCQSASRDLYKSALSLSTACYGGLVLIRLFQDVKLSRSWTGCCEIQRRRLDSLFRC